MQYVSLGFFKINVKFNFKIIVSGNQHGERLLLLLCILPYAGYRLVQSIFLIRVAFSVFFIANHPQALPIFLLLALKARKIAKIRKR